jgi:hypothetical protein
MMDNGTIKLGFNGIFGQVGSGSGTMVPVLDPTFLAYKFHVSFVNSFFYVDQASTFLIEL